MHYCWGKKFKRNWVITMVHPIFADILMRFTVREFKSDIGRSVANAAPHHKMLNPLFQQILTEWNMRRIKDFSEATLDAEYREYMGTPKKCLNCRKYEDAGDCPYLPDDCEYLWERDMDDD